MIACAPAPQPPEHIILWAWERPEDLLFLAPGEAEVALLVNRIVLTEGRVEEHPRAHPLKLRSGSAVLPVVRIEASAPGLDSAQLAPLVEAIDLSTRDSRFQGLQIDFDATQSQRDFYRLLLAELRPRYRPLSITALVSWCAEPSWMADLPVDEIVPMAFRMGPGGGAWTSKLEREKRFTFEPCNSSLGMSTDEPLRWRFSGETVYLFHPRPWSERAYREAVARLR